MKERKKVKNKKTRPRSRKRAHSIKKKRTRSIEKEHALDQADQERRSRKKKSLKKR